MVLITDDHNGAMLDGTKWGNQATAMLAAAQAQRAPNLQLRTCHRPKAVSTLATPGIAPTEPNTHRILGAVGIVAAQ